MKTKIFVSSNSGMDYLEHSQNISSFPSTLYFKREETYKDYLEMSADIFYNRLRLDPTANPSIIMPKPSIIAKLINEAIEEGYDNFFFLIENRDFGDVEVAVFTAIEMVQSINYQIFDTNTICYPHSYLALEADMLFSKGYTNEQVIAELTKEKERAFLYFFVPDKKDMTYLMKYSTKALLNASGTLYTIGKLGLETVNTGTSRPLKYLFDIIFEKIKQLDGFIPFILYTDLNSNFNSLIEEELVAEFGKIRVVPRYCITPAIGTKLGGYAVGLGIIEKETTE